jgi:hypothetical protein
MFEANLANNSLWVIVSKFVDICLYFAMISLNILPLNNSSVGENIIKYGYPIGHVTTDVPEGTWVSEKEIKTNLAGLLDYTYQPVEVHTDIPVEHRTFKGYRRRNGDIGVRNEIWIIPTVVTGNLVQSIGH